MISIMIEAIITIMTIQDIKAKAIKNMMMIMDIKAKAIIIKMTIQDINQIHIQSHIRNLTEALYKNITENQITDSIFLNLII